MRSRKSQENKITSSGSNEKNIQNKHENQEGTLQIVYKRFVTRKKERIMEKINYYIVILKEFIMKGKQTRKIESGLVE